MTKIIGSYDLIGHLVQQTFGVSPEVMAILAHGDGEVRLRCLPDTAPTSDPHDGVEVFVRRVLATSVAMRDHRGSISPHTELQARAAGWPTARLADMAVVLAGALFISTDLALSVPLLIEADEETHDHIDVADRLCGSELPLPAFDALCEQLFGNSSAVPRSRGAGRRRPFGHFRPRRAAPRPIGCTRR